MDVPNRAARRWRSFGKNIFSEMTDLARLHNAVNLAQGFPDSPGPRRVIEALQGRLVSCPNQYSPYIGEGELRREIARREQRVWGDALSPDSEVTVTSGATEALYAVVNAFVNPGDRVIVFEPLFDIYAQAVANAGGVLVPVPLHAPDTPLGLLAGGWAIDWSEFEAACSAGFALLILNSPHNPTAKVFSAEELDRIAHAVIRHDALLLSDEVYEEILLEEGEHLSPASWPSLRERVVRVSSVAKSFGFTGFKLGWVAAAPALTAAIRVVHQGMVFCTPAHIQLGFADLLADDPWVSGWFEEQQGLYRARRDRLTRALRGAGFRVEPTRGTYYLLASYSSLDGSLSGMAFARRLVERQRVAAIPLEAFCLTPSKRLPWLRFAFCKSEESIARAEQLLFE
jgi:aspartate/methionine/tyrosine aminotransferase